MQSSEHIQDWVEEQMLRGRYIFTREDTLGLGLPVTAASLNTILSRLVARGVVVSPWKNFYVTIPTEYRLRGVVPPTFYIDRLMNYLGRDYYVSLLSAAELNGAAHQRAMLFQVTVNGGSIRSSVKNGTRLDFTIRQKLPLPFVRKVKTQMGYMNVAGVELTALDLVAEQNKVGGLSRVAEVLVELCESMRWDEQKLQLLSYFGAPTIQRLGYLLEQIDEVEQADALFALARQAGKSMRAEFLKQGASWDKSMSLNKRWKIISNYKIEIDEI